MTNYGKFLILLMDEQWVAKKGPRDININISWATGKFFFFLIFNPTNDFFE